MGRIWSAFGLVAFALSGCSAVFMSSPYTDAELQEAQDLVTGFYSMDFEALMFACNRFDIRDRIDGCIQVVGDRVEIYMREGLGESHAKAEYRHLLGHIRHRVIEGGVSRDASWHSYSNAVDAIKGK